MQIGLALFIMGFISLVVVSIGATITSNIDFCHKHFHGLRIIQGL